MILNGGEDLNESFNEMLQQLLESKTIPREWTKVKVKSIHKRGSKKDLGNQRGLFLTNIISKVMERILIDRNKKTIEANMTPFQCGGVKNRGVSDNLFILNSVTQKHQNEKNNL